MNIKDLIKFSIIPLIVFVFIAAILWSTEKYLAYQYDKRFLSSIFKKRFIYLRNLPPNQHLTFNSSDIPQVDSFKIKIKDYTCTTDSNGFIVSGKMHQHPDLKFVFLGGSIPQSLYTDEDKRMPVAVTRETERLTGLKINVWNAAAGGTNSYHTLNVLNNMALQLKPDYAFFYGNINDIATLIHYGSFNNPNLKWGIFFNTRKFDDENRPVDNFLPYIQNVIKNELYQKPIQDDFADVRDTVISIDSAQLSMAVKQVFKTMIAVCKANNIKPVLITQVNIYDRMGFEWMKKNMPLLTISEDGYQKLVQLFANYNDLLRQVADEEDVSFIDLKSNEFSFSDFNEPSHFNGDGYVKVNTMIAHKFSAIVKY